MELFRKPKQDAVLRADTPQERVVAIFHGVTKGLFDTMPEGFKKFAAVNAYEIFSPQIEESVRSMSDDQVKEWLQFTRESMGRMIDVIEKGFQEGNDDGQTQNHDQE